MSNRYELNKNLAQMLKGGVIMDVTSPEQAEIAEQAGACAVMALERIPADIRAAGGVSRMSDPKMIRSIQKTVSIPVMAKVRIGHFVEAQILEALGKDLMGSLYINVLLNSELQLLMDELYNQQEGLMSKHAKCYQTILMKVKFCPRLMLFITLIKRNLTFHSSVVRETWGKRFAALQRVHL